MGEPLPARREVGVSKGRSLTGPDPKFARKPGGMGGQLFESDGLAAAWNEGVIGRIPLERIVEFDYLLLYQLCEQVGGEDLGERAETNDGVGGWGDAGVGCGFAIAVNEDLVIADDNDDHADGARVGEEIYAELFRGGKVGQHGLGRGLGRGRNKKAGEEERRSERMRMGLLGGYRACESVFRVRADLKLVGFPPIRKERKWMGHGSLW